ncbi:MAG: HAD family hydrolase [Bacteroidota bacterium]
MNRSKALILDLDDTIFETKTMDQKVFEPFFQHLRKRLESTFNQAATDMIIADLWEKTWDKVIQKHAIPKEMILDSIKVLDDLELDLTISPYPDYSFLKDIPYPKYLVTTSLTSLQQAKIRALNIEKDFVKIVINDTFKETRTKLDIFKELMNEFNLVPENTFVIGDNTESEIKAGNELNMVTIQMLRKNVVKGTTATYYIKSFEELQKILDSNANHTN